MLNKCNAPSAQPQFMKHRRQSRLPGHQNKWPMSLRRHVGWNLLVLQRRLTSPMFHGIAATVAIATTETVVVVVAVVIAAAAAGQQASPHRPLPLSRHKAMVVAALGVVATAMAGHGIKKAADRVVATIMSGAVNDPSNRCRNKRPLLRRALTVVAAVAAGWIQDLSRRLKIVDGQIAANPAAINGVVTGIIETPEVATHAVEIHAVGIHAAVEIAQAAAWIAIGIIIMIMVGTAIGTEAITADITKDGIIITAGTMAVRIAIGTGDGAKTTGIIGKIIATKTAISIGRSVIRILTVIIIPTAGFRSVST
jgi:lysylphosphatidylglycerol synthetase-like protein (DUF2156 family)